MQAVWAAGRTEIPQRQASVGGKGGASGWMGAGGHLWTVEVQEDKTHCMCHHRVEDTVLEKYISSIWGGEMPMHTSR